MIRAAGRGYADFLAVLLENPHVVSEAHIGDNNGMTPLMRAAWRGHADCVQLLLTIPSVVKHALSTKVNNMNALEFAKEFKQGSWEECVKLLEAIAPAPDASANANSSFAFNVE